MDIRQQNRTIWDQKVASGDKWTVPVGSDVIDAARAGEWSVLLTPIKPVPRTWFGDLRGKQVLCLASGGGQQGPVLAAAGASVTVFDNSPAQLDQDRSVAERDGLALRLEEGDMADLSRFDAQSFDLIFHPVSNCFVPDVHPVWSECARVMRPGASLLAGFCNPVIFCFDPDMEDRGILRVRYAVPYSDFEALPRHFKRWMEAGEPISFGHRLEDQIGGQLAVGLTVTGFYEDYGDEPVSRYMPGFCATRAVKPT
jgi:SAM-dependent methyltransferase